MTRLALIICLIFFCYKDIANEISLSKLLDTEYTLLAEESQVKSDEQIKSKVQEDDILYYSPLLTATISSLILIASLIYLIKTLAGHPILLFAPPDLL